VIAPHDPFIVDQLPRETHFWNRPSKSLPHASFVNSHLCQKIAYRLNFPSGSPYEGEITNHFSYYLNLINMASKAAYLLTVPKEMIEERLASHSIELMRTEIWRSSIGTTFINHPYCSDPQSVDRALLQLQGAPPHHKKIFVFGGLRVGGADSLSRVGHAVASSNVDQLLLYGKDNFAPLEESLAKEEKPIELLRFPSYEQCVRFMRTTLSHDDTVLIKGKHKESLDDLTECFHDSISHNQCIIDLDAIHHNLLMLRSHLPKKTRVMVMVKAQGYGTDDLQLAKYLERCHVDILGLSYVDEAVALQRAGVKQSLFVLNAAPYEVSKVVRSSLEVGVSSASFIDLLAKEADKANKKIKVHLHVDTGMSRFGCRIDEGLELAEKIQKSHSLIFEGLMTHLVAAENSEEDAFTHLQIERFTKVVNKLKERGIEPAYIHAQNSSGAVRFTMPEANMVRIGLALFGISGSPAVKEGLRLRLAVSLLSRIVGINTCKKGDGVGYGRSFKVGRTAKIAVLPIGYFDGLHRHYSGKGSVTIRGQKAPMVGKICMDYMMVDVTDIQGVEIGDRALFFGKDEYGHFVNPEDFVAHSDSIVYELVTCLGPRIQRIFFHD
jgi:alanine racemase/UDP-N-acetylmuramoyl-tripeptide--D-alanyl-D-alanine ligase